LDRLPIPAAKTMFHGVSTLVRVAQNADHVDDLAKRITGQEAEHKAAQKAAQREARKVALQAELAAMDSEPVSDVRPTGRRVR
jgi:hypothetical protein